ncbi:pheromone A receptor-domain-containing protein [Mycena leptocephala]|nr:pheromone A receptor-domain-containing protein [Mycena leptocephala]
MRSMRAVAVGIHKWLHQIASVRTVTKTRAEGRRAILIDLAIGLGIPLLQIPSRHRYNIFEDIGCLDETYETAPAVVLLHLSPSSSAPSLPPHKIYHSRAQFRLHLSTSAHNLNRYIRLMALTSPNLLLTTPLGIWVLWVNICVVGFVGGYAHERGDGGVCPAVLCVLGVADEATKSYRGAFQSVARRVGYTTAGLASGITQHPNSPTCPPLVAPPSLSSSEKKPPRNATRSTPPMSASYGRISRLEYEDKEKAGTLGEGDAHALSLADESDCSSSAPSSSSSDTESVGEEEGEEIEVSSLHLASVHVPTPPGPAHTRPASVRDAGDIV